jgi:hypothetical protein
VYKPTASCFFAVRYSLCLKPDAPAFFKAFPPKREAPNVVGAFPITKVITFALTRLGIACTFRLFRRGTETRAKVERIGEPTHFDSYICS